MERWRVMLKIESFEPGLIDVPDMKFVPKKWGYELWIVNNEKYCGKILFVKAGQSFSMHMHKIKDEVLYCSEGECEFRYSLTGEPALRCLLLNKGKAFHVTPGLWHQLTAITDTTIIEFSTQHFDEDSYKEEPNE